MSRVAGALLAFCLLSSEPAWATDDDLATSKPRTAEVVTLARLASVLCPEIDVDEVALHALMDKAGITDRDVVDPAAFGSNATVVARSFAQSFQAAPREACATIIHAFGSGTGHLLRQGKTT